MLECEEGGVRGALLDVEYYAHLTNAISMRCGRLAFLG